MYGTIGTYQNNLKCFLEVNCPFNRPLDVSKFIWSRPKILKRRTMDPQKKATLLKYLSLLWKKEITKLSELRSGHFYVYVLSLIKPSPTTEFNSDEERLISVQGFLNDFFGDSFNNDKHIQFDKILNCDNSVLLSLELAKLALVLISIGVVSEASHHFTSAAVQLPEEMHSDVVSMLKSAILPGSTTVMLSPEIERSLLEPTVDVNESLTGDTDVRQVLSGNILSGNIQTSVFSTPSKTPSYENQCHLTPGYLFDENTPRRESQLMPCKLQALLSPFLEIAVTPTAKDVLNLKESRDKLRQELTTLRLQLNNEIFLKEELQFTLQDYKSDILKKDAEIVKLRERVKGLLHCQDVTDELQDLKLKYSEVDENVAKLNKMMSGLVQYKDLCHVQEKELMSLYNKLELNQHEMKMLQAEVDNSRKSQECIKRLEDQVVALKEENVQFSLYKLEYEHLKQELHVTREENDTLFYEMEVMSSGREEWTSRSLSLSECSMGETMDICLDIQLRELKGQLEGVIQERDGLIEQLRELKCPSHEVIQERDCLIEQLRELKCQSHEVIQERDGLIEQLRELKCQSHEVIQERDGLIEQLRELKCQSHEVIQERDGLIEQLRELKCQSHEVIQERDGLIEQLRELKCQSHEVIQERDGLIEQLNIQIHPPTLAIFQSKIGSQIQTDTSQGGEFIQSKEECMALEQMEMTDLDNCQIYLNEDFAQSCLLRLGPYLDALSVSNTEVVSDAVVVKNTEVVSDAVVVKNTEVASDAMVVGDTEVFSDAEVVGDTLVWRQCLETRATIKTAADHACDGNTCCVKSLDNSVDSNTLSWHQVSNRNERVNAETMNQMKLLKVVLSAARDKLSKLDQELRNLKMDTEKGSKICEELTHQLTKKNCELLEVQNERDELSHQVTKKNCELLEVQNERDELSHQLSLRYKLISHLTEELNLIKEELKNMAKGYAESDSLIGKLTRCFQQNGELLSELNDHCCARDSKRQAICEKVALLSTQMTDALTTPKPTNMDRLLTWLSDEVEQHSVQHSQHGTTLPVMKVEDTYLPDSRDMQCCQKSQDEITCSLLGNGHLPLVANSQVHSVFDNRLNTDNPILDNGMDTDSSRFSGQSPKFDRESKENREEMMNNGNKTVKVLSLFDKTMISCTGQLDSSSTGGGQIKRAKDLYSVGHLYRVKARLLSLHADIKDERVKEASTKCLQTAVHLYGRSLVLVQTIGDRTAEGKLCGHLGNSHYMMGNFVKAVEYHEERLKIAKDCKDRAAEGRAATNLGNAYLFLLRFGSAVKMFKKSLQVCKQLGDKALERQACNNLGNAYTLLQDYKNALRYQKGCLVMAEESLDRVGECWSCWSLGNTHFCLGNHKMAAYFSDRYTTLTRRLVLSSSHINDTACISDLLGSDDVPLSHCTSLCVEKMGQDFQNQNEALPISKVQLSPCFHKAYESREGSPETEHFLDMVERLQAPRMDEQRVAMPLAFNKEDPVARESCQTQDDNFLARLMLCQSSRLEDQRCLLPSDIHSTGGREMHGTLGIEDTAMTMKKSPQVSFQRFKNEKFNESHGTNQPSGTNQPGGTNQPSGAVSSIKYHYHMIQAKLPFTANKHPHQEEQITSSNRIIFKRAATQNPDPGQRVKSVQGSLQSLYLYVNSINFPAIFFPHTLLCAEEPEDNEVDDSERLQDLQERDQMCPPHLRFFPSAGTHKPSGCDTKPSSCDTKPSSCDTKPSGCDTKPSGCDTKPSGCDTKPSGCDTNDNKEVDPGSGLGRKTRAVTHSTNFFLWHRSSKNKSPSTPKKVCTKKSFQRANSCTASNQSKQTDSTRSSRLGRNNEMSEAKGLKASTTFLRMLISHGLFYCFVWLEVGSHDKALIHLLLSFQKPDAPGTSDVHLFKKYPKRDAHQSAVKSKTNIIDNTKAKSVTKVPAVSTNCRRWTSHTIDPVKMRQH